MGKTPNLSYIFKNKHLNKKYASFALSSRSGITSCRFSASTDPVSSAAKIQLSD
jgi:hypothetical protein